MGDEQIPAESHPRPVGDPGPALRARWQSGDREGAYVQVVEVTKDSLYRFLRHILRDEEATREVFQETYLRVFRALGGFRGDAGIVTWVLTIGRNLALNRIRRERSDAARVLSLDDEEHPLREIAVEPKQTVLTRSLLGALDALPVAQREAVLLFYVEDLSLQEVASLTGRPLNTVKSDLLRARGHLRAVLGDEPPEARASLPGDAPARDRSITARDRSIREKRP